MTWQQQPAKSILPALVLDSRILVSASDQGIDGISASDQGADGILRFEAAWCFWYAGGKVISC